jgi:hypothetical protein
MAVPRLSALAPGASSATDSKEREAEPFPPGADTGTRRMTSEDSVVPVVLEPTSTLGRWTMRTSSAPDARAAFRRRVVSERMAMSLMPLGRYPSLSNCT